MRLEMSSRNFWEGFVILISETWLEIRRGLTVPLAWAIIGLGKLAVFVYPEGSHFEFMITDSTDEFVEDDPDQHDN